MKMPNIRNLVLLFCLLTVGLNAQINFNQTVSINQDGSEADSSAVMDMQSTNQGILVPRMTLMQRDSIAGPATGLLVFVTTDSSFYYFDGSHWSAITKADQQLLLSNDSLQLTNGGAVDLSTYLDNTDAQNLSLTGNNLQLTNGGSVDLSAYLDADNLGNHMATQNIETRGNWLSNDGDNEGMFIKNDGNVGVGTEPNYPFHFRGDRAVFEQSPGQNTGIQIEPINDGAEQGGGRIIFDEKNAGISHGVSIGYNGTANDSAILNWKSNIFYVSTQSPSQIRTAIAIPRNTAYVGLGMDTPQERLHVNGNARIDGTLNINDAYSFPNTDGGNGQILVTNGSGNISWSDNNLSLSANTLSLTNGSSVNLSGYLDNTDTQDLSLTGNNLQLTNGGSVDLSTYLDNTDAQNLSLTGNNLQLTNGGSVDLSAYLDNTDTQDLSLSGNTLSLTNGGSVDLSSYLDADNLGNHVATQNIQTNGQWISNDGDGEGIFVNPAGRVGIGTGNPQNDMHVRGSSVLFSAGAPVMGIEFQPQLSSGEGGGRIFFKEEENNNWGFSFGYNGGFNNDILNWPGNSFNISRHQGNDVGAIVMNIQRATGNVGIGTANPQQTLHVGGNTRLDGTLNINDDVFVRNDGYVGIGTTSPGTSLHVTESRANGFVAYVENTANAAQANGLLIEAGQNVQTSNNRIMRFRRPDGTEIGAVRQVNSNFVDFWAPSDVRLKKDFKAASTGLDDLLQIEVMDYIYIDDPDQQETGFIAQQLYEHYPYAVTSGGDDPRQDPWSVSYARVTPLLVKAVQEQQEIIEDLKSENEALKARLKEVASMEARLARIEALLEGSD